MKVAPFQYHRPQTIEAAVGIMAQVASDFGRVLAGGQSLVPAMALRLAQPTHLVDINNVNGLDRLAVEGNEISIGACVRHANFCRPVVEGPLGRLLSEVVKHIAHHQIRKRGTFCGSLANADPASEWCLTAATLDAKIVARSTDGTRVIPSVDYFQGVMSTALKEHEILTEVRLSLLQDDVRFGFYEFSRQAGDFALVMALVTYRVQCGAIVEPRVGLGGIETRPRRLREVEEKLIGQVPDEAHFRSAARIAADIVSPFGDTPAGAEYRRELAPTAIYRALKRTIA